jgi:hypothetical protein
MREVELAILINFGVIRLSWNCQTAKRNGRHGPYFFTIQIMSLIRRMMKF